MKRTLLFIPLLFAVLMAQAQTKIIFEETTSDAYLMKHGSGSAESQQHLNAIVSLLGEAGVSAQGGRPSRSPEYTVRVEQQARITDTGNNLLLKVKISRISVGGDTNIKGFDVSEVLRPEELLYKVKLLNAKNELVKEFVNQRVLLSGNDLSMLEVTIPDTAANQNFKLKIEEKQVLFTAADVQRVKDRLALIRSYFAADATVLRALQDVTLVRPDDIDRLPLQERNLRDLETVYADLKNQFQGKLNLEQNDPQRLSYKMKQLHETLLERRRAIDHAFATLDQQFFNRGIHFLNNGNRSAAQAYFAKSVDANPKFAPAHVQLARLDFMNGYIREATNRTRDVLTRMRVDRETEAIAMTLMHEIYTAHIGTGNSLTNRGEYHNALAAFAEARDICSTIGGLRCSMAALNDGEARAATGAYRAMVDNGRRLLARNDLKEAERAAEEALGFQEEYDFVLSREKEATELLGQVKFQYYLQHIDLGKRHLNQQNFSAALSQFESALSLENKYAFKPVQELGRLAQQAAKPVLLAKLSEGYEQAIQNKLSYARQTASTAADMQNRYGLQSDAEVLNKHNLLRERIFTQECINTQAAYDKHYQNGLTLAKEKKFIAADQAYLAAIRVADEKSECAIATLTAQDSRTAIVAAATYQRMMESVERQVGKKRYAEAVQEHNQARDYYLANKVSKYGLDHISLYNFAKDNRNQNFTAYVVGYLAGINEEEVSIQLLTTLLDKGYAKRKTKKVQEQLGKQLALKDTTRNHGQAVEVLAVQYTQNHKGLKKLRKAYKKESKRLAKG
ncbi:hypothetical protein ACFSRY_20530 [Pontibacter locisalis]|uniref:Tetratricopeptide repeat-containing protein n=1 Tax=Pontibacter locisalis TaxID=1719035 RepID=A0ABW5IS89_9BACT